MALSLGYKRCRTDGGDDIALQYLLYFILPVVLVLDVFCAGSGIVRFIAIGVFIALYIILEDMQGGKRSSDIDPQ